MTLEAAVMADVAFPFAAAALDPETASRALSAAMGAAVEVTAARAVRHRPGRRFLVRYATRSHGEIVGKVRAKGTDVRTFELQSRLHAAGWRLEGGCAGEVPPPLGVVGGWSMTLQGWVAGVPAAVWFGPPERPGAVEVAGRLGALLGEFHRASVVVRRRHGVEEEMRALRGQLALLRGGVPEVAERLDAAFGFAERIAWSALSDGGSEGLLHRDYHPEQVLLDGGRAVLLDLDTAAVGHRAIDVGNMAAHWVEAGVRAGDARRYAGAIAQFEAAYLVAAPGLSRGSIAAATACSLLRLAGVAWRIEGRRAWALATLAEAERWLGAIVAGGSGRDLVGGPEPRGG